jgi:hypothetical protein
MPLTPEQIALHRCYVTPREQVRKVLLIDGNRIWYVARGGKHRRGWEESGHREWATKEAFAAHVDREVSCDWDRNYPERAP